MFDIFTLLDAFSLRTNFSLEQVKNFPISQLLLSWTLFFFFLLLFFLLVLLLLFLYVSLGSSLQDMSNSRFWLSMT